jgi:hypothetical protein
MKLKITSFIICTPHKVLYCVSGKLCYKALRVARNVVRKGEMTAAYSVLVGKREEKRPLTRGSVVWNYNIKTDLKEIG